MKHHFIFASLLTLLSYNSVYSAGLPTSPGKRDWENAADNVELTNSIESKVCNLTIPTDFNGTFTVLDVVLSKICIVESKAEHLETQVDLTEINFNTDLSKVCAIEDSLHTIQLNLESLDTAGTFTALEGLKQTVCSKIELLNQQLSGIQTEITDLTATEIDHAATIASQLDILDNQVMSINSILDILSFDLKLNTACSLLDVIDNCLQTVESKVDLLDATIEVEFAGTFTTLDANLQKVCTIESLVDAIPMSFMADLSETFSALNALQEKICTIGSKVDNIDMSIMSIESEINILDSKLDPVISKLCIVESKTDTINTNICFSLFDNAIQVLDQDCSILEELNDNQMLEKACTIESNLDVITNELSTQDSKLEVIEQNLNTIASKVCAIQMDNTAISKLCLVDSKLDIEFNTALAIESLIDVIEDIGSAINIDVVDDLGQTILSKLCVIEDDTQTTCSQIDLLNQELQSITSTLDLMDMVAQSNLDGVITIESRIDAISLDQLVTNTLTSKLCLIDDQVCTVASNVEILESCVGVLNIQAQELIGDFQETWTILQVIEDTICTSESLLDDASDELTMILDPLDFSGVFTAIEPIDQKAITVDGKVNTYESLVDAIVDIDFSGVFTVLDVIESKICLIDDLAQLISTGIEDVSDCLGTPIYNADLPLTISTSGRYYLAENIDYAGTTDAITISAVDDVFLDLNDHALTYIGGAGVDGIMISTSTNVQIVNGAISAFSLNNIEVTNCERVKLHNLNISFGDIFFTGGRNIVVTDSLFYQDAGQADSLSLVGSENVKIKSCTFLDGHGAIESRITGVTNMCITDCVFKRQPGNEFAVATNGITTNVVCQGLFVTGGRIGVFENTPLGNGIYVLNSTFSGCSLRGVTVRSPQGIVAGNAIIGCSTGIGVLNSADTYVAFNSLEENNVANIFEQISAGSNTYLGNFAFNSNAAGNPNNTNYNLVGGSDITRKFVTISNTSSFSDRPTEWHNINMLP